MCKKLNLLYLLLCLLTIQVGFSQTTWYVDDNVNTGDVYTKTSVPGSDAVGTPGTAAAPFATLLNAINRASNGDTILIDKVNFVKSVGNRSLNINKSVTIIGAGTGNTIFSSHTDARFATVASNNVTIKNLQILDFI